MNLKAWTNVDRRVIYTILVVIVVIGLIVTIPLPITPAPATRAFFDAVEHTPVDKLAILSVNWSAATEGENRPQTMMIMTHFMSRHIRFAILSFDQQGTTLAQAMAEELGKQYGYRYGVDFINWGYRADVNGTLKGIVADIEATIGFDSIQHKRLGTFPIMRGVHNIQDIGIVADASPSGTYENFIGFVTGTNKNMPYCFAPTSVMAPDTFSYLDSGQIKGMLFGIKGAAEYEKLLLEHGIVKQAGFTTRAMTPVSLTLILLFVFIGLGNWGMFVNRRAAEREAR